MNTTTATDNFAHDGMAECNSTQLPLYLLRQDNAIGGVLLCELDLTVLHTKDNHWLCTIVVDGSLTLR